MIATAFNSDESAVFLNGNKSSIKEKDPIPKLAFN